MFSDPADVAPNGVKPEDLYPNTIFLPGTGIQRGSTDLGDGDPLSQGWPSVPNAYRYVIKNIIQFGNCEDIPPITLIIVNSLLYFLFHSHHLNKTPERNQRMLIASRKFQLNQLDIRMLENCWRKWEELTHLSVGKGEWKELGTK